MALFVGEFDQVIDAKHRLAIPAALREQIDPEEDGRNFYLVLGTGRRLWLYPDKYYRRLLSMLRATPLPNRQTQQYDMFFAMARVVKPDSQGRIVLPEKSMNRAKITDPHITLVGKGDHIEIWPTKEWNEFMSKVLERYDEAILDAGDRLAASGDKDDK